MPQFSFGEFLIIAQIAMVIWMAAAWVLQLFTKDGSWVDVFWAGGLGLLAGFYAVCAEGDVNRRWLVGILGGFWSARLVYHLLTDRIFVKLEDGRYARLRQVWGDKNSRNLFFFDQAQGFFDVLLSIPFLLACMDPRMGLDGWDWAALLIGSVSCIGEAVADFQLARFKSHPANKGRVCKIGLWYYSRHPNYFFEWLIWIAFALPAVGGGGWGWIAFFAPAIMLVAITKVTGIPPNEEQAIRSRGDAYREYQRTTNAFFPWLPRS